jgi:hypothetical protein
MVDLGQKRWKQFHLFYFTSLKVLNKPLKRTLSPLFEGFTSDLRCFLDFLKFIICKFAYTIVRTVKFMVDLGQKGWKQFHLFYFTKKAASQLTALIL